MMDPNKPIPVQVSRRRFWIQFLFSTESMLCGLMFSEYLASANATACFYGVGISDVNWAGMVFLLVYVVFILPGSYLFGYLDLRWTVIGAAAFNTAACALQFLTLTPDGFPSVMGSMFLASLSNLFILAVPPVLAAKWFPENELSRSCAFGVFGNQLGVALGFILNPLLVSSDCSNPDLIGAQKLRVTCLLTSVNAVILVLILFTFQNAPKFPPSVPAAAKERNVGDSHLKVLLSMVKNVHFLLILFVNGLMVGSYFALSTVLNDFILHYFPNQEVAVGLIGLLLIISGLVGSVIAGYILDSTKLYKETTFGICLASLVSCVLFCSALYIDKIWVQFITISVFGFFLTGFLPVGFEYGIEVTYPLSENISTCLINTSSMVFGLILTPILSFLLNDKGPIFSSVALTTTYLLSCVTTCFITKDYKRSKGCASEVKPGILESKTIPDIRSSDFETVKL